MKKRKGPKEKRVKTTLNLPIALWKQTRIRAIEEGIDAQDIVARALREHLKKVSK